MSSQDDMRELITLNSRRLRELKKQRAIKGLFVDPAVTIEIEDIESEIEGLEAQLKKIEDKERNFAEQVDTIKSVEQNEIFEVEIKDLLATIRALEEKIKVLESTEIEDFSPLTKISSSDFDKINHPSFFKKGERYKAGGMLIIPARPDKDEPIKVSGAHIGKRNAYITVNELGHITVESWNPSKKKVETQVSLSKHDWPHKPHTWQFERLDLAQGVQLEDSVKSFDAVNVVAVWWIWHKAKKDKVAEKFLILVGNMKQMRENHLDGKT